MQSPFVQLGRYPAKTAQPQKRPNRVLALPHATSLSKRFSLAYTLFLDPFYITYPHSPSALAVQPAPYLHSFLLPLIIPAPPAITISSHKIVAN